MHFFKKFTFPMNHEPKRKSFEWIIHQDKVFLRDEIKELRKHGNGIKRRGLKEFKLCSVRNWFMDELGLFTGLRVEEMVDLKIKDILINDRYASVVVRNGKGGKKRIVKINDSFKHTCSKFIEIRKKFELSNDREEYLLTSQKGKRLTTRALQKQFKICLKEANLPDHYSIHCLRHTYATNLLKASGNLKLVKEQLGHSSIKTTEVYIALVEEDTKKALNKLYKG
jgi:site-specific recombinase XerD